MFIHSLCVGLGCVAGAVASGEPLSPLQNSVQHDFDLRMLHGITRPGRDVTLSFYIDGTVSSLPAEGTLVGEGDLLASLDDRVAQASLRVAEIEATMTGELESARSRHRQALRSHARLVSSAQAGAVHPSEVEASEAVVEQSAAEVAVAESRLAARKATVELRLATVDEHTMEAPFEGVVLRVDSEVGLAVSEATPLIRLVDLSTIKVDLHIPVELYGTLKNGNAYAIDLGSPVDAVVTADLVWAEPMVDPATETFRAVFVIDNAQGSIPSGVTAQLTDTVLASLLRSRGNASLGQIVVEEPASVE